MSSLIFHIPPVLEDQNIETSFASDGERILRMTLDRSDQSARIAAADWPDQIIPTRVRVTDDGRYANEALAFARWLRASGVDVCRPGECECDEAPGWSWELYCREQSCPAPFVFEPWNHPPLLDDEAFLPVQVQSDGEQWCLADAWGYLRPLGFARLDAEPYGALQRPDSRGVLMRLANGHWSDGKEDLGRELVFEAFDYPGHVAACSTAELGCECPCGCDQAALSRDAASGLWLCAECLDAALMPLATVVCSRMTKAWSYCPFCSAPIAQHGTTGPLHCQCATWRRQPDGMHAEALSVLGALAAEIPEGRPLRPSEQAILAHLQRRREQAQGAEA